LRTGLRLEDLLSLQWRHVHLQSQRIHIPAAESSGSREIEVTFDREVLRLLVKALRLAWDLPSMPRRVLDSVGLPLWKGRPAEREIRRLFQVVQRKAGIRRGDFDSLRLTFLRNCAKAGVPPADAERMCDWDGPPEAVRILYCQASLPTN
jgi:integrase